MCLLFVTSFSFLLGQTVSNFENLTIAPNTYWNGASHALGTSFESGNATFVNYYDTAYGGYWSRGWAYSNVVDSTTAGMGNMYATRAGSGFNGSSNYIVAQVDVFGQVNPKVILNPAARGKMVSGAYITNATYTAISMRDGDAFGKKFGGVTGNDPDWLKITIKKWANGTLSNDSVDFYLADFRSSNNSEDYILTQWQWVDLTSLGNVDSLTFVMSSSDVGQFGINTPLFFCMDNFTTADQGVGVDLVETGNDVMLFPNPAQNVLNITTADGSLKTVSLFDQSGRLVHKSESTFQRTSVDISNQKSGIYFLQINGNNINYSQKVIIQ